MEVDLQELKEERRVSVLKIIYCSLFVNSGHFLMGRCKPSLAYHR